MPIAIYHLSLKIITRGKGKSAVAAAAYRAGETIKNERDGILHDYSRKTGVAWSGILLPENAPAEYKDREVLWNAVEKVEKASNSQLAREVEIALPKELHFSEYFELVLEYVRENFTDKGMYADIAIHTDKQNQNPHCHIMLTMRPFTEDGTWGDKQKKVYHLDKNGEKIYDPKKRTYKCSKMQTTDWNERHKAEEWRASWADKCNKYLERHNHPERIDHRSYKRQGIEQIPTIHLGVAAHQMEQRGIRTERGDINRAIEISNRKLRRIEEQINELQGWLAEEMATPEPQYQPIPKPQSAEPRQPTFAEAVSNIIARQAQGRQMSDSDNRLHAFLKMSGIKDYGGIEQHLKNLMGQQRSLTHELSPIRKRLAVLAENMKQHENYKIRRAAHDQYQQDLAKQMPWKKKSFAEDNRHVVENYDTAKRYMNSVKNAKGKIPLLAWQREYSELSAKLRELDGVYQELKAEVAQVDKFRVRVYGVLRGERQAGKTKSQEIGF